MKAKREAELIAKAFELHSAKNGETSEGEDFHKNVKNSYVEEMEPVTEVLASFARASERLIEEDIQHMGNPDLLVELTDAPEDDPRAKKLREKVGWRTWKLEAFHRKKHVQSWMT